jgi:hypothetical protein
MCGGGMDNAEKVREARLRLYGQNEELVTLWNEEIRRCGW